MTIASSPAMFCRRGRRRAGKHVSARDAHGLGPEYLQSRPALLFVVYESVISLPSPNAPSWPLLNQLFAVNMQGCFRLFAVNKYLLIESRITFRGYGQEW